MTRTFILLFLLSAGCLFAPLRAMAAPITIDTVPVGNPGNAPDQLFPGVANPLNLQFGSVGYNYRIGSYEVTNSQYAAFLNAKAASDPLGLFDFGMQVTNSGGITRSGASGSYTYTTKSNMGNKPVNWVTWYDAVRFANWLHNGQGLGDTETGAYTLLGGTATPSNGPSITRNPGAVWFLTSEDEWYKAAYHQPAAQGGDVDNYWLYPTATNAPPTIATANATGDISNPGTNVANYEFGADWNTMDGNVTTVGSTGPSSQSFYGTSDQGGNVWEWNESMPFPVGSRSFRGGSYASGVASNLESSSRAWDSNPYLFAPNIGFRVATVPEPSSLLLATAGFVGLFFAWRRRKRR